MSMLSSDVQRSTLGLHTLEQYEPLIGTAALERIAAKANRVFDWDAVKLPWSALISVRRSTAEASPNCSRRLLS